MMATTPTPALAELRQELDRLDIIRADISARNAASPNDEALWAELDKLSTACLSILDQVAACPATTLSDLRIKAHVFNWSANLVDGESYTSPTDGEEQIMRQLVAGLLDERIA